MCDLPNDINLGCQEIRKKSGNSQNILELLPSSQSSFQKKTFCQFQQKSPEKQKLNFSHSALFHMKTRVCLRYFVNENDCLWKQFLASNLPQIPSNLICLTNFVNLRPWYSLNLKLEQVICTKKLKMGLLDNYISDLFIEIQT